MRLLPLLLALWSFPAWSQANRCELRFSVADPSGAARRARIELDSRASQFHESRETDATGHLRFAMVPLGAYDVTVEQSGFASYHATIDIHSAIPRDQHLRLPLEGVRREIRVSDQNTLIDLYSASTATQIRPVEIENRLSSLPGRSVQELVVSQPGWLYEGNAVLHPRGSEYQTQFVVDGIPLMDNRSPGFGTEIEGEYRG